MTEDSFDLAATEAALAGSRYAGKLHHFPAIASTNTHAMSEANAGAPDGSVYFADEQTGGRGRGDHTWVSPPGSGLYVSVLLRPRIAPTDILWLSLAAGLAVQQAIRKVTSLEADLRWPNDLLLGRKKFCGILTELNTGIDAAGSGGPLVRHAVVGIGVNVHQEAFPPEIRDLATSLRIETGRAWPRQELLIALLQSLDCEAVALAESADMRRYAETMRQRLQAASSWMRGKRVRVEDEYSGTTAGLDARGFLLVRTAAGLRTVYSGGVREA